MDLLSLCTMHNHSDSDDDDSDDGSVNSDNGSVDYQHRTSLII
jgi:hypothetical protein